MRLIPKSSFTPTPWKNGGGITHEAIRIPPDGNSFRWRVSVAEIDSSGPFSEFAEYNRKMVLLRGSGLNLTFDRGRRVFLRQVGDLAEFDGAVATECELLSGSCVDLNLIVAKSVLGVRAWVECLDGSRTLQPPHHGTLLAFSISGTVSVDNGTPESALLHAWDLLVISEGDHCTARPAVSDGSALPLVFFASLDDNSP
ncbi:MAG: hutD family protein [Gammaproteobacteria bacterium]|nr:hutD family protein [Gammaproteobacteria bacterium]